MQLSQEDLGKFGGESFPGASAAVNCYEQRMGPFWSDDKSRLVGYMGYSIGRTVRDFAISIEAKKLGDVDIFRYLHIPPGRKSTGHLGCTATILHTFKFCPTQNVASIACMEMSCYIARCQWLLWYEHICGANVLPFGFFSSWGRVRREQEKERPRGGKENVNIDFRWGHTQGSATRYT